MAFGRLRGPRVQELKSSGGVVYSVQSTLPETSSQVGEVPVAVSWVWHPGAPRGGVACGEVGVPAQGRHVLRGPSM